MFKGFSYPQEIVDAAACIYPISAFNPRMLEVENLYHFYPWARPIIVEMASLGLDALRHRSVCDLIIDITSAYKKAPKGFGTPVHADRFDVVDVASMKSELVALRNVELLINREVPQDQTFYARYIRVVAELAGEPAREPHADWIAGLLGAASVFGYSFLSITRHLRENYPASRSVTTGSFYG